MIKIPSSEIEKITINESSILGFEWTNGGKDFVIKLDWAGQQEYKSILDIVKETNLNFFNVFDFKICFDFHEYIGTPFIDTFKIESHEGWSQIKFSFLTGPSGEMSFKCVDLDFTIVTSNAE